MRDSFEHMLCMVGEPLTFFHARGHEALAELEDHGHDDFVLRFGRDTFVTHGSLRRSYRHSGGSCLASARRPACIRMR